MMNFPLFSYHFHKILMHVFCPQTKRFKDPRHPWASQKDQTPRRPPQYQTDRLAGAGPLLLREMAKSLVELELLPKSGGWFFFREIRCTFFDSF